MHELSIMQDLFTKLDGLAARHSATRVAAFEIEVGVLANVVPELLAEAFRAFRASEPLLAETRMRIVQTEFALACDHCGEHSWPERFELRCLECGSTRVRCISGEELLLRNVELDIPEAFDHVRSA